jgi:ribosomal protein L16/L10AE
MQAPSRQRKARKCFYGLFPIDPSRQREVKLGWERVFSLSYTRIQIGKGAVEYYAKWVSPGAIIFEVSGVRKETAVEAMRVAGAVLPLKTKFVEVADDMMCRSPAKVLPHFIKKRLDKIEFAQTLALRVPGSATK